jgi:hypothetical protein
MHMRLRASGVLKDLLKTEDSKITETDALYLDEL